MSLRYFRAGLLCTAPLMLVASACTVKPSNLSRATNDDERQLARICDRYVKEFRPLFIEREHAWWEASITGSDAAFARRKKADAALVELHSDKATFDELTRLRESSRLEEPALRRQLTVLYHEYLRGQADPDLQRRIVDLQADVEQIFNTHRGLIDGKPHTENEIREILSTTSDHALAEKAWKAYMDVGAKVEPAIRELVTLRNQMARQLGYPHYYAMMLDAQELDEQELLRLFDELDSLTRPAFAQLKSEIDAKMAARFGVAPADLRPWSVGDLFFQEAPDLSAVRLDDLFADRDIVELTREYYESLGMPIDDILRRSDLYEKEGKSPHAFCTNLDRQGDVRVLCNIKPNLNWMDTTLHEIGHAVYDKYISRDVPYVLRTPSHILTTEGVAMLFGAMSKNPDWLVRGVGLAGAEADEYSRAARQTLRAEKLIFSRWCQVMLRFEHGMYSYPDQDLGRLWWDLKQRYQLLNPPDDPSRPDYGAKVHIVVAPAYYHNYMLGDLFACQVHSFVAREVLGLADPVSTSFYGSRKAGDFMRREIFEPGNLMSWNELTRGVTGEPLTPKYFAEVFVGASPDTRAAAR